MGKPTVHDIAREAGVSLATVDRVLNAAALTYVAAVVTSLLTLIYYLLRAGFFGGRRD